MRCSIVHKSALTVSQQEAVSASAMQASVGSTFSFKSSHGRGDFFLHCVLKYIFGDGQTFSFSKLSFQLCVDPANILHDV